MIDSAKLIEISEKHANSPASRAGWTKNPGRYNEYLQVDPRCYVSYNGQDFIRELDALEGFGPSAMDSGNPETALVIHPPQPLHRLHLLLEQGSYTILSAYLGRKDKKKMPWYHRLRFFLKEKTKTKHFILRGDHRERYEELAKKGRRACLAYFNAVAEKEGRHFWSN